ncbi:putative lipid phosphate phosphatase 3, chloroplastic isoform X2 [Cucumis melo]|uniref:Lipid phosphate phosphatase 3, chloroplastic isoform X2 n=1 Tax=Cucumis melo TaxID=3656 RepID=A0A1S4DVV3_CUCME|nr:putative lipid phosphate phosphatase 3, chloroplastic isoform X2 [Cucumis melo]
MREPDRSCRNDASGDAAVAAPTSPRRRRRMDWLMVLVLMFMYFGIYLIHPFQRFVGSDMITHLKCPLITVTVPFWTVPLYAVVLPIGIFVLVYMRRRDAYDLHDAILGILFSVLVTGVLTETTKNAVGWPRPDFFWRCFPDGNEVYDRLGNVVCHGKKSFVLDGYKSFPSGHASCLLVAKLVYLQFFPSPHYHRDDFVPTPVQSRTIVQTSDIPVQSRTIVQPSDIPAIAPVGRPMDIEAPAPLESRGL